MNPEEVYKAIAAGEMVYIGDHQHRRGRSGWDFNRSKWYNPHHKLLNKGYSRDQVLSMYRDDLLNNPELLKQLPELKGKVLACWCKPERCHGDILLEQLAKLGAADG